MDTRTPWGAGKRYGRHLDKGGSGVHSIRRRKGLSAGDQLRLNHENDNGGEDQQHEQLDHQPRQAPPKIQAAKRQKSPTGAPASLEGFDRALSPAPLRTRGNRDPLAQQTRQVSVRQLLVVRAE